MSKALAKKKNDTFNRIQALMNGEPVVLTADEENVLKRWNYAHSQILTRKYTEDQVTANIAELFHVSQYTARNDYYKAMSLYASLITVSKKFLMHRHAENILMKMQQYAESPKLIKFVPKLMDAYTKAVMAIPDDTGKEQPAAPIINFTIITGQSITPLPDFEQALSRLSATDVQTVEDPETPESYDDEQ